MTQHVEVFASYCFTAQDGRAVPDRRRLLVRQSTGNASFMKCHNHILARDSPSELSSVRGCAAILCFCLLDELLIDL